ncbi:MULTISPECIES: hypothetical protein [unclassified Mesorhizobium]|uniref:hypothetical protein n=1 Tax=unclassified Mesorhizobium TaxID=325217 RepID=UPI001FEDDE1A|nr:MULTISPECIES: hypothetical protein [unclassified Mesorhizobium]
MTSENRFTLFGIMPLNKPHAAISFARKLTSLRRFRQMTTGPTQVANRAASPFHRPVSIWHAGSFKKGVMRRPVFSDNSRSFHAHASAAAGFWKTWRQARGRDCGSTTLSKGMNSAALRMRKVLSAHGGLVLKLSVLVWTILILAAAFFMSRA